MNGYFPLCVVDTNVPMTANNRFEGDVSGECVLACIRALKEIMEKGRIALDNLYLIMKEYENNLRTSDQPGFGYAFYKWVKDHYANPIRCELVTITPKKEDSSDFKEFPCDSSLKNFDPSDRKFVAVSAAHNEHPPILQAVDSKWWGWKNPLSECGIQVNFLCPEDIAKKFTEKMIKS